MLEGYNNTQIKPFLLLSRLNIENVIAKSIHPSSVCVLLSTFMEKRLQDQERRMDGVGEYSSKIEKKRNQTRQID